MTSRHYGQFLDSSDPDQTQDDVLIFASTPIEIRSGTFRIGYIPKSVVAGDYYLLSVDRQTGNLDFLISAPDGARAVVMLNGTIIAQSSILTFSVGQELTITYDGAAGTVEVSGATTGNGVGAVGSPWGTPDGEFRLGGEHGAAGACNGYVSPPYAVSGATPPESTSPTVTSIVAATGPAAGGTNVTIAGTGFRKGNTVKLGGTHASSVVAVSSTSITCTTPAHAAGVVDVVVENSFGTGTLAGGFTYT